MCVLFPDRLSNIRSLSAEERGLLSGLCAGMDDAQSYMAHYIDSSIKNYKPYQYTPPESSETDA
jgi:hypothetical protein